MPKSREQKTSLGCFHPLVGPTHSLPVRVNSGRRAQYGLPVSLEHPWSCQQTGVVLIRELQQPDDQQLRQTSGLSASYGSSARSKLIRGDRSGCQFRRGQSESYLSSSARGSKMFLSSLACFSLRCGKSRWLGRGGCDVPTGTPSDDDR